jgi:hypothetical protein
MTMRAMYGAPTVTKGNLEEITVTQPEDCSFKLRLVQCPTTGAHNQPRVRISHPETPEEWLAVDRDTIPELVEALQMFHTQLTKGD